MLVVPVLFALIALSVGDDPAPCCTDRQYQAVMGRIGGTVYPLTGNTVFIDGYEELAYDFYRKRVGSVWHQRLPDGSMKQTSSLADFAGKRKYVYSDGKCTITAMDEEMVDNCISANATFLGNSKLGFGSEMLSVNSWEFMSNGATVKVGVTEKGCVPVSVAAYGKADGVATNFVEIFSGFKPGIDHPENLDIPADDAGCVFVDIKQNPKPTDAPVVGRRGLF